MGYEGARRSMSLAPSLSELVPVSDGLGSGLYACGASVCQSVTVSAMSLPADQREWNDLALADPMWAVCSDPAKRGSWHRDAFLETGQEEVDRIMRELANHGWAPEQSGSALDFGCGLGRLTRALGNHFAAVVGIDIQRRKTLGYG